MRFFTRELIWAANDWVKQSRAQEKKAFNRYWRAVKAYRRQLAKLRPRLSKPAFNFFMCGFGRYGLHDARLLRFCVGDGLDFRPTGKKAFYLNRQYAEIRIEFLNYYQDLHYRFSCRGVKNFRCSVPTEPCARGQELGDLYTYEITELSKDFLQLAFLFVSGGTIEVDFSKLVFRRKRVRRKYEVGEMYR